MSRTDDGHNSNFPFGNPFRLFFSRKSHIPSKFLVLLNDFELMLARSLTSLVSKDSSAIFALSWMKLAVESLSEIHTNINGLINDLQLPLSDWGNSWIDVYLEDSIKLLDICIALSSEISRLGQTQLLFQHFLHIFDLSHFPSSNQLKRAAAAHKEFMGQFETRSSKLEQCSNILLKLVEKLYIGKVKGSSRGILLMRALHGVKIETIFVCSIIIAVLSGSSKPLIELNVSEKYLWSKAFNELQGTVLPAVRSNLLTEKVTFLEEIKAVEICAERFHSIICKKDDKLQCQCNAIDSDEFATMEESASNENREVERKRLQDCVSDLADKAGKFFEGVEILSSRVDGFFHIVLTNRDALLANLRGSVD